MVLNGRASLGTPELVSSRTSTTEGSIAPHSRPNSKLGIRRVLTPVDGIKTKKERVKGNRVPTIRPAVPTHSFSRTQPFRNRALSAHRHQGRHEPANSRSST
jgi:hypothetical protein